VRAAVAVLREARAGGDHRVIRRRIDELDQATRKLAELTMDRVVKQVLVGKEV
jgi:hypothetical protein